MIAKEFQAHGFDCLVRLISFDDRPHHYCGYVIVPDGHPMHKRHYSWEELVEAGVSVHGGVTWQGFANWADDDIDGYLVGFDCNHAGDRPIGAVPELMMWGEYDQEWSEVAVMAETSKLACQLRGMWR